jgi:hypothetical protein
MKNKCYSIRASHGGEVLTKLSSFLLCDLLLFDVKSKQPYLLIDAGCGEGIFLACGARLSTCRPKKIIGVDIDQNRIAVANERLLSSDYDRNQCHVYERDFVPSKGEQDVYISALKGSLPVYMLMNNFRGCLLDSLSNKVEDSPQVNFEVELGEQDLFAPGSKIISFEPLSIQWSIDVFKVDLPKHCISWSPGGKPNFYVYKYTKMRQADQDLETNRTERRTRRTDPKRIEFVDLDDQLTNTIG